MGLKLPKKPHPLPEPPATGQEAINKMTKFSQERRTVRLATFEKRGKLPEFEVQRVWERLMKEWYPEFTVPTLKQDMTILKVHLKKMSAAGIEMISYLEWVMGRWDKIVLSKFPHMKARPQYPRVRFLVRFSDEFVEAYRNKARLEREVEERLATPQDAPGAKSAVGEPEEGKRPAGSRLEAARGGITRHRTPLKPFAGRVRPEPRKSLKNEEGSFGKWEE